MADGSVEVEFAPHFNNAAHEKRAAQMGMWLFLVNEVMLFAGLFTAFFMYRYMYTETFRYMALMHLDAGWGTANTVVLLLSSFTVLCAVLAAKQKKSRTAGMWLLATIAFAGVFLVVKYFEYSHKIHVGTLPGQYFSLDLAKELAANATNTNIKDAEIDLTKVGPGASMFFTLYFFITGLHAIHILIGMGILAWLAVRCFRGEFDRRADTAVELGGMYWHLVDLIWIYVYPMLYLL